MAGPWEVLCVGAANLDTIALVDVMPRTDERVVAHAISQHPGGPASTAAVAVARLGVGVAFCGRVGADAAGQLVTASLQAEGVDTTLVETDGATAQSVILSCRESNTRAIATLVPEPPRLPAVPPRARWVHVDHAGYDAVAPHLADPGRAFRISIDAGNDIAGLRLAGVDLFVPTVEALRRRYGALPVPDLVRHAHDEGAVTVVATDGGQGCYVSAPDVPLTHVPGFTVEVVSTLGAGDVFHGALVAGLAHGFDLVEAARYANAVAALSCRALDGRSGIPTFDEVTRFLLDNGPQNPQGATQ